MVQAKLGTEPFVCHHIQMLALFSVPVAQPGSWAGVPQRANFSVNMMVLEVPSEMSSSLAPKLAAMTGAFVTPFTGPAPLNV